MEFLIILSALWVIMYYSIDYGILWSICQISDGKYAYALLTKTKWNIYRTLIWAGLKQFLLYIPVLAGTSRKSISFLQNNKINQLNYKTVTDKLTTW